MWKRGKRKVEEKRKASKGNKDGKKRKDYRRKAEIKKERKKTRMHIEIESEWNPWDKKGRPSAKKKGGDYGREV